MNELRITLAPSGALTLRQQPEWISAMTLGWRTPRLIADDVIRRRRHRLTEETMHPDHHNFLANPAQGSFVNAGQFGSIFASHPCRGCEERLHAYDAEVPARPLRRRGKSLLALLTRASR